MDYMDDRLVRSSLCNKHVGDIAHLRGRAGMTPTLYKEDLFKARFVT